MDVYIHGATDLPLHVTLSGRSHGSILYRIVKDICDVRVELQLLLHTGKVVQWECALSSQGIKHGTTVLFCVKGIGGGGNVNNAALLGKLDECYEYSSIITINIL